MAANITVEKIEQLMHLTIRMMALYELPLLPHLQRLKAERDKLLAQEQAIDLAKKMMERAEPLKIAA